jgi:large subunit ribosomal protein L9
MDVILREHIENLGQRGEIVKVSDGYARNFLLPRKLALPATEGNRKHVQRERKIADAREAEEKKGFEALAARIQAVEVVLTRRVGETDALYGSVTTADIAASLADQKIEIDRRKIQLLDPIKQIGEFKVPIKLHREVTAEITVRVEKQAE